MGRKLFRLVPLLIALCIAASAAITYRTMHYSKFDKRHYQDRSKADFIRPGLDLVIEDVSVSDGAVSVTFSLIDDLGVGLDRSGLETPGVVSTNFLLGVLAEEGAHYQSYINRVQESSLTGDSAIQPTSETGGSFQEIEVGRYRYTFQTLLPEGHDPDATHAVGIYARRDLRDYELGRPVDNEVFAFVPSGGEPHGLRDVISTETCNSCHDPLALHGGSRQDMDLCVMCHYPGVIDPDTGNSVDMAAMTHKIHMGENLPSVQSGTPYQIIGFRNTVHDYSEVVYPREVRDCTSCHKDDAAQHEVWLANPTMRSCGSCHDEVNFTTGEGHANLPQVSDNLCSNCHFPEGELEFDTSIVGSHTIPDQSQQLAGINITVTRIENVGPGLNPTVVYQLESDSGEAIEPSSLPFLNLLIAGPSLDYAFLLSERAVEGSIATDDPGVYTYTFNGALPEDATGTFAISGEAFRNVPLNAGTVREFSHRETAPNPVLYFSIDGGDPLPRREIVTNAKCNSCHGDLKFHGDIRQGVEYCVVCHQTSASDAPFRPEDQFPARTIDFKFMIHRIHMGEDLTRDYTLVGFMGSQNNYNHLLYPGDLRNCASCHVNDSYNVPTPSVAETVAPNEFFSPIPANSASCLGCHDTQDAAAHAFVNISPFGEACGSCHGENAEFAVARIHARNL